MMPRTNLASEVYEYCRRLLWGQWTALCVGIDTDTDAWRKRVETILAKLTMLVERKIMCISPELSRER